MIHVGETSDGISEHPVMRKPYHRCAALVALSVLMAAMFSFAPAHASKEDSEPAIRDITYGATGSISTKAKNNTAVQAVALAAKGKYDAARNLARKSGNRAAVKAVEWLYIRRNPRDSGYDRLMAFVEANPHWPYTGSILARAEALLLADAMPLEKIAAHFSRREPKSPEGWLARARYVKAKGSAGNARARLLKAWLDPKMGSSSETYAARHFKSLLRKSDHEARLWALVMAQQTRAAVRVAGRISKSHVAAAKVARALIRRKNGADSTFRKLPKSMRQQIAMKYALSRYYRKKDKLGKARAMLLAAPKSHAALIDPEQWWIEKRLVIRQSLSPSNYKRWHDLYKLATSHGFSSGKHFLEGEFLSGWMALRKLNQPPIARNHFRRMASKARTRTDSSRAHYWIARSELALGNAAAADKAFRAAAASPTLYYGQLAREALGHGRKAIRINAAPITDAARKTARNDELLRAFRLFTQADVGSQAGGFLRAISERFKTASEMSAAAAIVKAEGGTAMSVRFAKMAGARGIDIDDWGYPRGALPSWKSIGPPVERALVYGLSRQESEFHPHAKSHAGARGLMQIMPGTGKLIARQYKIRNHSTRRLTAQPSYNVMLGAAHLGDLVKSFKGSYILTFVGYNAGPGRARQWIKRFGDPRDPKVDAIDWVETIPFTETRKYVQKVLQNVHVYRSRLGVKRLTGMSVDLERGNPNGPKPTRAASCGAGGSKSISQLLVEC